MTMKKFVIVFIFILSFVFNTPKAEALDCLTINANSPSEDKAFCQKELNNIEAELAQLIKQQAEQKKNTGTLTGDVKFLNSQIAALKTKVKARALVIAQLKASISEKACGSQLRSCQATVAASIPLHTLKYFIQFNPLSQLLLYPEYKSSPHQLRYFFLQLLQVSQKDKTRFF